jgi:PAS domain S-box-containing protein
LIIITISAVVYGRDGTRSSYCLTSGAIVANETVPLSAQISSQLPVTDNTSHKLWKALLDDANIILAMLDLQGKIVYFNHVAKGYTSEQILNSSMSDWVIPEHRPALKNAMQKVIETGERVSFEANDRLGQWFRNDFGPVYENGKIVALSAVCYDITHAKKIELQAQQQRELVEFILSSVPVIMWSVDHNLIYTSYRDNSLVSQGLTQSDFINTSIVEKIKDSPLADMVIEAHKRALQGATISEEVTWLDRHYQAMICPLRNVEQVIIGVLGCAIDITEQKKYLDQVLQNNVELEKRVQERTLSLQDLNHRLLQEKALIKRMYAVSEREKEFIAHEIHDGLIQDLSGVIYFQESLQKELEKLSATAAGNFMQGMQILRNVIGEARRIMNFVCPESLQRFGLIDALDSHIEQFSERTKIPVDYSAQVTQPRFDPMVEWVAFRIVQEALNNVWKHSAATRAEVAITKQNQDLLITIQDNGKGIDDNYVNPEGHGLISMQHRARVMGGECNISKSLHETGTTVNVRIPIVDKLLSSPPAEIDLA